MSKNLTTLNSLRELAKQCREATPPRTIGLCNGCFDGIHSGHIHHFNEAKQQCDVLVVLVTADDFIHRGPNRPLHGEERRKYVIENQCAVTHAFLNHAEDAIDVIAVLKPDFYFKGYDYSGGHDHHGKLQAELEAVYQIGGKTIFTTEGPSDSSTRVFRAVQTEDSITEIIDFMKGLSHQDFVSCFDTLGKYPKITVFGDKIVDVYTYGEINGIANKRANVSLTYADSDSIKQIGGAEMISRQISKFVYPQTCFGGSEIVKERYINKDNNQAVFETKNLRTRGFNSPVWTVMPDEWEKIEHTVFADFGHYFFNRERRERLMSQLNDSNNKAEAKKIYLMVQANSSNFGFNTLHKWKDLPYPPHLVSLDLKEGSLFMGREDVQPEEIVEAIYQQFRCEYILLTLGKNGMLLSHHPYRHMFNEHEVDYVQNYMLPAINSTKIVDTMGCGDAAFSLATFLIAMKADPKFIVFGATLAGWLHAQILGNTSVTSKESFLENAKAFLTK